MNTSHEEPWRTTADPRALLRLTRARPSGRKYLLLACAVVRRLRSAAPLPLGGRVLDELERYAASHPARGVKTRVWEDVVVPKCPGVSIPLYPQNPGVGADAGWLRAFSGHLPALSRVRAAVVHVTLDTVLYGERAAAGAAAGREVEELADRLTREAAAAPGLFGWVFGFAPARSLPVARFREAVLAQLAPETRPLVREVWPIDVDAATAVAWGRSYLAAERVERRVAEVTRGACDLVREVFGNPFRSVPFRAEWREANFGTARRVAEHIAATGNYSDVPVLGDALEDAGCDDEELLAHCRGGGHVPGCWAVDAVLGRA